MTEPDLRGSGRTTRQIQHAPQGAIYVWCNHRLHYPAALAKSLGRTDLEIVSRAWLDNGDWTTSSRPITIDHGCFEQMTPEQMNLVRELGRQGRL